MLTKGINFTNFKNKRKFISIKRKLRILVNDKNYILETLGKNYKIWQINTRISSGKDKGLSMHEDSPGQANIWFFINTQNIPEGVTGVVPSSHLFPRICKKLSLFLDR